MKIHKILFLALLFCGCHRPYVYKATVIKRCEAPYLEINGEASLYRRNKHKTFKVKVTQKQWEETVVGGTIEFKAQEMNR